MKSMKAALNIAGIASLTAVMLTGCSAAAPNDDGGSAPTSFTFVEKTAPGTLSPHGPSSRLTRFLYGRLIHVASDGDVDSLLAEKWEQPSTTNATFVLYDGLTCDDGTPLNASGVAAAIEWAADPANKSIWLGTQIQPGTTATGDDASRTVTVTSSAPDPFLLQNIGQLPIICPTGIKDPELLKEGKAGTGPYEISKVEPGQNYSATLRKDFVGGPAGWKASDKDVPATVTMRVVSSETTTANLLINGEVDQAFIAGPEQKRLKAAGLTGAPYYYPVFLNFNEDPGNPGSDIEVRRAVVSALDLEEIGKVLSGGEGKPMTQAQDYSGPMLCRGDTVKGNLPKHDVESAKQLLSQAGWEPGADGVRTKDGARLSLDWIYVNSPGSQDAAAELAAEELKKIGVEIVPTPADGQRLFEALSSGKWGMMSGASVWDNPAQMSDSFIGPSWTEGGMNTGGVKNAAFEKEVALAKQKIGADGCDLWLDAERDLIRNIDLVPVYKVASTNVVRNATLGKDPGLLDPYAIRMKG